MDQVNVSTPAAETEPTLERLRLLAVALPLAYVLGVVGFLAFNPFPSWASALVAVLVSVPLVTGFTVLVFNVVSSTRADLVKREQRFASLLEAAPDGIVIVDAAGTIAMVNAQAVRMFGYAKEELIGNKVELLVPEASVGRHVGLRESYDAAPAVRPMGAGIELHARRKDGSEFPVEISLSPISQDGSLLVHAVVRDISERRALQDERERLLTETEARRERERIAMDLHDGIIQSIYAVTLGLETVMEDVEHTSAEDTRRQLNRAMNQLDEVTRDIRSYIFHLRPPRIEDELPEALRLLAENFRVNSLIETSLAISPEPPPLPPAQSLAAYHVAQEALHNVRKHARASRVALSLTRAGDTLRLEVRDNGVGFTPGGAPSANHHGLRNMAERAEAIGAGLAVESEPGCGTLVRLDVPLQAKEGTR